MDDDHEAMGATSSETPRARGALKNAAGVWPLTWLTYTDSSQPRPIPGRTSTSWASVNPVATTAGQA